MLIFIACDGSQKILDTQSLDRYGREPGSIIRGTQPNERLRSPHGRAQEYAHIDRLVGGEPESKSIEK